MRGGERSDGSDDVKVENIDEEYKINKSYDGGGRLAFVGGPANNGLPQMFDCMMAGCLRR